MKAESITINGYEYVLESEVFEYVMDNMYDEVRETVFEQEAMSNGN